METKTVEIKGISQEELDAISKDINAILEKYDEEIKVSSQIHILKRQPTVEDITEKDNGNTEESQPETNAETAEGSESDSGESAK